MASAKFTFGALFFAFGLLALAAGRPLTFDVMGDSTELMSAGERSLLCSTPDCVITDPLQCNFHDLSGKCYFSPAMLKLPSTVTGYWCGLGCSSTVSTYAGTTWRYKMQQNCPAIACGSTIGSVTATGPNGCASSSGYVKGLASGQTTALYNNADASWLTSQFKSFCSNPTFRQLKAVAGMLAQGLATAQAKAQISGCLHVCGCCDGSESASQSISVYTTAAANAIVQSVAQAITSVFGNSVDGGDCYSGAVLAEAPGFAQALSQDLIEVTNEWYKELSLAKTGNPSYYNQVCKSSDIPWLDTLKVRYANAYACAITTVLSSAYNDASTATGMNVNNSTVTAEVCADNYDIAWTTDWCPGTAPPTCACAGKCHCADNAPFVSGPGCPAGVQVCKGGSCDA